MTREQKQLKRANKLFASIVSYLREHHHHSRHDRTNLIKGILRWTADFEKERYSEDEFEELILRAFIEGRELGTAEALKSAAEFTSKALAKIKHKPGVEDLLAEFVEKADSAILKTEDDTMKLLDRADIEIGIKLESDSDLAN